MSANTVLACPHCHALNRVPIARLRDGGKCGRCKGSLFTAHPVALDAASFDAHVTRADLPVLVDFWAPWCGPCRAFAPVYERAAGQLEPRVRLAKLDTEAEPALAGRYGIRSIPTLVLFRQGVEIDRVSGALDGARLVQWVNAALARAIRD